MEVRSTQTTLFPEDQIASFYKDFIEKDSDTFVTVVPVNLESKTKIQKFQDTAQETSLTAATSPGSSNGFVTVVQVGGGQGGRTVVVEEEGLIIEDEDKEVVVVEDEVTVFRLPGERLGMGLQFDGGTHESEFIRRLYIQSVATDSPAARTCSKWGKLEEGDQILKIDDTDITQLTRVQCVSALRCAPVAIRLLVRHNQPPSCYHSTNNHMDNCNKPPPVPPRRSKVWKMSSKDHPASQTDGVARFFDGTRTSREDFEQQTEEQCENIVEPVQADVYVDLIAEEDGRSVHGEYESDDTASSASTVIEKVAAMDIGGYSMGGGKCQDITGMVLGEQKGLEELGVLEPPENFQDDCPVEVEVVVPKPRKRPPVPARISKKVECPPKPPRTMVDNSSNQRLQETGDNPAKTLPQLPVLLAVTTKDVPPEPDCDSVIGNSVPVAPCDIGDAKVEELPRVTTCEVIAVIEKLTVGVGVLQQPPDTPSAAMTTVGNRSCNNQLLLIDVSDDPFSSTNSTCSRLPPDGHEFPPNYQETLNCNGTAKTMSLMDMDFEDNAVLKPPWGFEDMQTALPPPLPTAAPPPPPQPEKKSTRNGDQKVGLSVKDKIAMFASLEDVSAAGVAKLETPVFVDISIAATKEKEDTGYSSWDKESTVTSNIPPPPKPAEFQHWRSVTNLLVNDRPESSLSTSSTLSRSSDDLGGRSSKTLAFPCTSSSDDADQDLTVPAVDQAKKLFTRRSLYSLMESRMQTVSKLRGLVIPDAPKDPKEVSVEHLPTIVTALQVSLSDSLRINVAKEEEEEVKKEVLVTPPPKPAPRTNVPFRKSSESLDISPTTPPIATPRVFAEKSPEKPTLERTVSAPLLDGDTEESVRILKANSVEAINRMNVLRSAKKSSGARVAVVDIAIEDTPTSVIMNSEENVKVATIHVVVDSEDEKEVEVEEEEEEEEEEETKMSLTSSPAASSGVASTPSSDDEGVAHKVMDKGLDTQTPVPVPKAPVSSERWSQLEEKYRPKASSPGLEVNDNVDSGNVQSARKVYTLPRNGSTGNGKDNFKAISEKWKERASTESLNTGAPTLPRNTWKSDKGEKVLISERKLSAPLAVPVLTTRVTLRNNKDRIPAVRPASMVENSGDRKLKAWDPNAINGNLAGSKKVNTTRATSFGDLRQVFERQDLTAPSVPNGRIRRDKEQVNGSINSRMNLNNYNNHARMSSLDSTGSADSDAPVHYGSVNSLPSTVDHYGSVTSLASSTSLISPQELQQLIDEANQSLEEFGSSSQEVMVVVLQRETLGGSIGVTLAGGADYDSKEITINKIIKGSLAERDGRIQRCDRVISINGKNLRGVTHKEALNILKAPRSDCVLVLSRNRTTSASSADDAVTKQRDGITATKHVKDKEIASDNPTEDCPPSKQQTVIANGNTGVCIEILKDGAGLGFTLDGGKQSPLGDKPLTVKKIFSDKGGILKVGDEILSINGTDATNMARSEAWNFMRKLPDGVIKLIVRQST